MFAAAGRPPARLRDELPGTRSATCSAPPRQRYGPAFADVLATCRIWVNGDPAERRRRCRRRATRSPCCRRCRAVRVSDDSAELSLDELRPRRRELQAARRRRVYVRRVAQGRADLARAELARRTVRRRARRSPTNCATCSATGCSAPRTARRARPRTSATHPRADELDQLCADTASAASTSSTTTTVAELARRSTPSRARCPASASRSSPSSTTSPRSWSGATATSSRRTRRASERASDR